MQTIDQYSTDHSFTTNFHNLVFNFILVSDRLIENGSHVRKGVGWNEWIDSLNIFD